MRRRRGAGALLLLAALSLLPAPTRSLARELFHSGDTTLNLGATYKNLFTGSYFYEIPDAEDRGVVSDLQRARLMLDLDFSSLLAIDLHYQHLALLNSSQMPITVFRLQAVTDTGSPYRLDGLGWALSESDSFSWWHEFDRLSATLSLWRLDLTVGRQAITWGTGRFWQPTDLFSPFGPLQLDREFKAGTDAVRGVIALGDFTQIEGVWAFGKDADVDRSAGLGRFKTLVGSFDLSVLAGRVQTDVVAGGDFAGDLGDTGMGVHGEILFNAVRDAADYFQFQVGLDYRFPGKGPYVLGEYFYNGVGATGDLGLNLALVDDRILSRGTFQLGRHYLGLGATYEILPILEGSLFAVVNLTDPSALLNPLLEYSVAENASLAFGAAVPLGDTPTFFRTGPNPGDVAPFLRSEFGTYPLTVFIEVKAYLQ